MTTYTNPNPDLDLIVERTVDVAPELVWKAWTTPELLVQWFTPKPWSTVACEIDLRPGGRFHTVMRWADITGRWDIPRASQALSPESKRQLHPPLKDEQWRQRAHGDQG